MWLKAEEFLAKDKYLGPLVAKYGHCKIRPRPKNKYFIDLVDAIVSQQLSVKAAATIFKRLEAKVGVIVPEKILAVKDKELRACGLSWAKVKYVKDLAQRTEDGQLKIEILDKLSDEEVAKELIAVKGIGRWTADMFLVFSLARPDIFPVEDLGIRKGMVKLTKKEMDKEALTKFAQTHWQPFRSIASWYIWRLLDNQA